MSNTHDFQLISNEQIEIISSGNDNPYKQKDNIPVKIYLIFGKKWCVKTYIFKYWLLKNNHLVRFYC